MIWHGIGMALHVDSLSHLTLVKFVDFIFDFLQWHDVTNTVWWQDFPRLNSPNCLSLFTQLSMKDINIGSNCDFAAQLAGFMASLVADVPGQASWILELIKYDFSEASGYLVASVPGIHSQKRPVYELESLFTVSSCFS